MLPIPLPAIPFMWKLGGLALLVALVAASSYVAGRKAVRAEMQALKLSYEVAAAQAAGREAERGRQMKADVHKAGERYVEQIKVGDSWLATERGVNIRLRDSIARSDRVRAGSPAPAGCPDVSQRAKAELLGAREAIAELAESANRDRLGFEACISSWPG